MSVKYKEFVKINSNHLIDANDWVNFDIKNITSYYPYIILEFYNYNVATKMELFIEIKVKYDDNLEKLSNNVIEGFQHYLNSNEKTANPKDAESFMEYLNILIKLKNIDFNLYASTE
jgi:hypothetical protein